MRGDRGGHSECDYTAAVSIGGSRDHKPLVADIMPNAIFNVVTPDGERKWDRRTLQQANRGTQTHDNAILTCGYEAKRQLPTEARKA